MSDEAKIWTTETTTGKLREIDGRHIREVTTKLLANGRCVHRLRGERSKQILSEYAEEQNRIGTPEPPPKTKIRLDGEKLEPSGPLLDLRVQMEPLPVNLGGPSDDGPARNL